VLTGKLVATNSEQGLSAALTAAHRPLPAEPLIRAGRRCRHAIDGRAVRHRPHHRRGFAHGPSRAKARGFAFFLRHAGRGGDDGRRRGRAITPTTNTPFTPIGEASVGRGIYDGPGHLDQTVGAASALLQDEARPRDGRNCCPRVKTLALLARSHQIGFNIDAEGGPTGSTSRSICWRRWRSIPRWGRWNGLGFGHSGLWQALPGGNRLVDRPSAAAPGAG